MKRFFFVFSLAAAGCISVPSERLCVRGHHVRRSKPLSHFENGRIVEGTWEWNEWRCDLWERTGRR